MDIAVVSAGSTWGSVNPDALGKGLGGRESAAVYLAECWSEMGHRVHVFAEQGDESQHYHKASGGRSSYLPSDMGIPMLVNFPYDAVVSWEDPTLFAIPEIAKQDGLWLCGMQVAHLPRIEEKFFAGPDCWIALGPWAADFLDSQSDQLRDMRIQPNGIRIDNYKKRVDGTVNDPKRFLYASSPDRGLAHLLRAWPKFRAAFPDCELHIAYGLDNMLRNRWQHTLVGEMGLDILTLIGQDGVFNHGKIGQYELAEMHWMSDALLYPCDPIAATETGCITVIEACATGNVPIISDADCLPSEFDGVAHIVPLPWDADRYIGEVRRVLEDPKRVAQLRIAGRAFAESRDWTLIAASWIDMIEDLREAQHEIPGNER